MTQRHIELHQFPGGICPPTQKALSTSRPIAYPPLAKQLILPIQQHTGMPGRVLVKVGEQVKKGQMLVDAQLPISVAVHASTSGIITAIDEHWVPHPSGMKDMCIFLEPDGLDESVEYQGYENYLETNPTKLLECIRASGISGLGGAGFPTDIKLKASKIETLIINGAECEPYISADDMLMRERSEDILQGILILLKLTKADVCLVGIEDDKPQAIFAMKQALEKDKDDDTHRVNIVEIPTRYPSGGEKQLIKILTGKEVPSGKLPANIGVLCQNVGTAYAVQQAVALGRPLVSRITTLAGGALSTPMNLEVPLGTPIGHLLEYTGLHQEQLEQLIIGGPLMGFPVKTTSIPITKISNCILATKQGELSTPEQARPCIRCGYCTDVCPAQLLPQQLYWFSTAQEWQKAESHNLFDCIECGACAYVCPSEIPLVQYYRFAKGEIRQDRAATEKSDRARERFEFRNQRIEREKVARAARRQARANTDTKVLSEKSHAKPMDKQPLRSVGAIGDVEAESIQSLLVDEAALEAINKKIRMMEDRVGKARERYEMALSDGLDTASALKRAFDKQETKLTTLLSERERMMSHSDPAEGKET